MSGRVVAVSRASRHRFSKAPEPLVRLVQGLGIEGDAHAGKTVQHRYDARRNPRRPNLRQVHLLAEEDLARFKSAGFAVTAGELGENVLTHGFEFRELPLGTLLRLGPDAVVEVTGLRDPCRLIDRFRPGLLAEIRSRNASRGTVPAAGIMSIVRLGGEVRPGDPIGIDLPPRPHRPLTLV